MTAVDEILALINPDTRIIAIDGRSASGKTTFASRLAAETGGTVIHMDDFFLPPEMRTAERLAEKGGNVHYERFMEEVLPFIRGTMPFSYRRFDCSVMDYEGSVTVDPSSLVIVEGAYSLSPRFGKYYDLSLFMTVDEGRQIERIIKRNGYDKAHVFKTKWIPLEESYFSAFSIEENADCIICCQEEDGSIPS